MSVEVGRMVEVTRVKDAGVRIPERFFSLDVVRGLAAFSVIFWHWQHFFYNGAVAGEYDKTAQPFYSLLSMFYNKGWIAVDFFFSLSGFIFFWLYSERVSAHEVTARNFAVLRFSRLYPLHLLTLVAVLVGQQVIYGQTGQFFVYPFNDLYHFFLNLLFASSWGFERGFSFNAPTSSVSIEILIYALFFILCSKRKTHPWLLSALVIVGLMVSRVHLLLGRGLFSFFFGGLAFYAYLEIVRAGKLDQWVRPLTLIMLSSWAVTIFEIKFDFVESMSMGLSGGLFKFGRKASALTITGFLFPITILALALIETKRGHLGGRLSFLGDLSYSLYLLHFPLQLVFISGIGFMGLNRSFFYSPVSMLLFLSILILLCLLSYRFLERPAQNFLRRKLLV